MIVSTGAGFLAPFFSFHPFNPQKPLRVFWRWVTPPPPPLPPPLSLLLPFLPAHMKGLVAADTHCAKGLQGEREAYGEGRGERESDRETEMDWFPPPAPSVQSQLAVQRLGRTRHVPGRVQLPVCGQDLAAPGGPRDRQAAPQTKHLGRRKGKVCGGHGRTHAPTHKTHMERKNPNALPTS